MSTRAICGIASSRWLRPRLVTKSREGRTFLGPSALLAPRSHGRIRLNPEAIVDGASKLLFAPEVPLRRLNRNVSQQELNLVQFSAGDVAQPRTRTAEIIWRQPLNSRASRRRPNDAPEHLADMPSPQTRPCLVDRSEHAPLCDAGCTRPCINGDFHPQWNGAPSARARPCRRDRRSSNAPRAVGSIRA